MDETTGVRSLIHAFFRNNGRWHVTAVNSLLTNYLKGAHLYVRRRT